LKLNLTFSHRQFLGNLTFEEEDGPLVGNDVAEPHCETCEWILDERIKTSVPIALGNGGGGVMHRCVLDQWQRWMRKKMLLNWISVEP